MLGVSSMVVKECCTAILVKEMGIYFSIYDLCKIIEGEKLKEGKEGTRMANKAWIEDGLSFGNALVCRSGKERHPYPMIQKYGKMYLRECMAGQCLLWPCGGIQRCRQGKSNAKR